MRPLQYACSNGRTDAPTPAAPNRAATRLAPLALLVAAVAWAIRGGTAAS